MATEPTVPVIDGHNDILSRGYRDKEYNFVTGAKAGHLDLEGAFDSGFAGGFFAIYVPSTAADEARKRSFDGNLSTPGPIPLNRAQRAVLDMFSRLRRYVEESQGRLVAARRPEDLEGAVASHRTPANAGTPSPRVAPPRVAAVCHMEGAEAIDSGLKALDLYYEAGLRSLGLVWSRTNRFATGVPFAFDRSPDIGPGLTRAGRELVARCNGLGIIVDLSHLNAAGFRDVAKYSKAPLVASHSNAWSLCKSTRNLTDDQLAAIRDSDGLVGINFGVPFLRGDGGRREDTPISVIVDHLEYIADRVGIDRVGFGSDFDGVLIPTELGGVRGLPSLIEHLRERGWSAEELEKIAHRNWIRVFRQTISYQQAC
ncbi:MAG: dipeptidase [Spirochaetaceae bacterium]